MPFDMGPLAVASLVQWSSQPRLRSRRARLGHGGGAEHWPSESRRDVQLPPDFRLLLNLAHRVSAGGSQQTSPSWPPSR